MRGVQRSLTHSFAVIAILVIAVALSAGYFTFYLDAKKTGKFSPEITSFEECAKRYPVMESYPEQCNTPDGKHFTKEYPNNDETGLNLPVIQPTTTDQVQWRSYSGQGLSLIYPEGYELYTVEASVVTKPNIFSASEKNKFIAFYVPQTDNGFILQFWSNPKNLTVPEWWESQFASTEGNLVFGVKQIKSNINPVPEKIGVHDLYTIRNEGPGGYQLFKYNDQIVLFSSALFGDWDRKILESLK